jgi:hypothetical protein
MDHLEMKINPKAECKVLYSISLTYLLVLLLSRPASLMEPLIKHIHKRDMSVTSGPTGSYIGGYHQNLIAISLPL